MKRLNYKNYTAVFALLLVAGLALSTVASADINEESFVKKGFRGFGKSGEKVELTDEQKAVLEEARALKESGDIEGAKTLLEENGIDRKMHGKGGGHHGHRRGHFFNPDAKDAIEANDYAAWQEALADRPIAEIITESQFAQIVEAHELHKEGDREGAHKIMKALRDEIRAAREAQ